MGRGGPSLQHAADALPGVLPLALLLATVPFWIGAIDVSDVGPPPVV